MKILKIVASLTISMVLALIVGDLFNLNPAVLFIIFNLIGLVLPGKGVLNVVVSNPLIGKSKQSMGNATFSTWKGINVLKEKPQSVANPNSDTQQMQRSAFTKLVLAFRNMPSVIRSGFKKLAVKKSEFNAFMSYNLKHAFDFTSPPAATFIPDEVLISKGTISQTAITSLVADRSLNTITVGHATTTAQPGQSASDIAIVAAYNSTKEDFAGEVTSDLRSDATAVMAMPSDWEVGDTLYVYLAFVNPLSGESSDSDNDLILITA